MDESQEKILEQVSKIVDEAPRLFEALKNDSWD